jgi:hypothetical protein
MKLFKYLSIPFVLLALSAASAPGAVIFKFGNVGPFIINSETGLSDAKTGATGAFSTTAVGGSAGVTFDITLTPNIRTISVQNQGVGVSAGSAGSGLDNNSAGDNFQEGITVTISNFAGLAAGETLVITDLRTRFGNNGGETYTINGGSNAPFSDTISDFDIDLPDAASFTIGAGSAGDTRFVIGEITVEVVSVPEPSTSLLIGTLGLGLLLRRKRA